MIFVVARLSVITQLYVFLMIFVTINCLGIRHRKRFISQSYLNKFPDFILTPRGCSLQKSYEFYSFESAVDFLFLFNGNILTNKMSINSDCIQWEN